ncbi:MAG: hypothetical protein ABW169_11760 [Sphingobium sp.]
MSSIGSVGASGSNAVVSALQSKGLSQDKIKIVEDDLQEAQAGTSTGSQAVDAKAVRAALDSKIADDVASGTLSEEDAATISKALDEMDGTATSGASASGGAKGAGGARPAGGGGGGGGGSEEKTELSRTETVSGGVKTTVITYTDGTTETKTTYGATDTSPKAGSSSASASDQDADAAQNYLSKIEPGTLFDAYA